jgi:bud site selection protein 20
MVALLTGICRLKQLKEGPYTHEEANAAVSYRIDNGPERTKSQEIEMS